MTHWWYSTDAHPRGASPQPWFRVEGQAAFPARGHPSGASRLPCLRIADGIAYPTMSIPDDHGPRFEIHGRDVYLVGIADGPWYRIAEA